MELVGAKYKKTDIGIIPSDWNVKKLGEIGENIIGLTYSPKDVKSYGHLVLRSSNIQNNKLAFENNVFVEMELPSRVIVKENDILICVRNGSKHLIGKCALIDKATEGSAFGAFMSVYRTNFAKFIFHQLQSSVIQKQIDEVMGATINQLTNKDLATFQIPFPQEETEQTLIATALSDADALIGSLEKLIAKKRNIKQGAMQKLLQPKEGWEEKKLGEICDLSSGTAHENFIDSKGNYVVINSKFISTNGEVRKYANTLFCPAKIGDILIVLSDVPNGKAIAKCFLVDKDIFYTVNQRIGIIKPFQNISSEFLYFLINRNPYLLAFDDGAKQTNLRNQDVRGLPLTIPKSKEEQDEIANILSNMDAEIQALETKLEKCKKVKLGMMQNLLTGKIRLI